ncbi:MULTISPECIES: type II toxin-antitoxin system RelE/ParE family toxin [unclassified Chryseobacterium]|uniref:type II toxin-antitoxin system RelE/ParE family toxin n=1 Tax=unclassified Chryseobacterium TaxID=2593645 RepID=UPI00100BB4D4|nr:MULTISPECIES: type II toxin-antitoxin system RelE/ParE family toxin [unclassified Chryseobacterium]RXM49698.1 addiction module toxin RelE [Chryseobacterium sp. CH25]RXM61539.1 addiction module toxin RelE [Chryseobacterium sp. CH1]
MARRKIIWTFKANQERKDILEYWILRNKSKTFSLKLNKLILYNIGLVAEHPTIGRKTDVQNVRVKIVRDYLIFYEFSDSELIILSVWDGRRNDK